MEQIGFFEIEAAKNIRIVAEDVDILRGEASSVLIGEAVTAWECEIIQVSICPHDATRAVTSVKVEISSAFIADVRTWLNTPVDNACRV